MRYRLYFHQMGSNSETLFYDSQAANLTSTIVEPKLKLELSKAGTLEFKIMPTHPNFGDFHKLSTYVRVMQDNEELFRGRVLNVEDTTYLERTVECEGDLAYLVDSLQPPDKTNEKSNVNPDITVDNSAQRASLPADLRNQMPYDSTTVAGVNLAQEKSKHESPYDHFVRYITNHNSQVGVDKRFRVGNVTIDNKNVEKDFSSSGWRDTKEAFDSDLIKYHGGYLQTRAAQDNGLPYIDYLKEPTEVSSQPIMLGVNIVELKESFKGEDIFTVFVPIGKDDLTIESVNNGNKGIVISEGVQEYGYIYKSETFSSISNATDLYNAGLAYINANYKHDPFSITVKAIDIHMIDSTIDAIKVGSIVNVVSDPHDLDEDLVCISIEYDIQNPENNEYEIGDPTETLSQKNVTDDLETSEDVATAAARSSYSASAGLDLQGAVNRQAAVIADQADTLYSLDAETIRINAKTIEIVADLLEIKTKAIDIQSDTVTVMASVIELDGVTIEPDGEFDVHISGSLWADEAYFDGVKIPDDKFYGFQGSGHSYMSSTGIYAANHYVVNAGGTNTDLRNSIVAFGTASYSGNTVSIPYTTADGDDTHILSFNKAATPLLSGGWSNGTYEVTSNPSASNRAYTEIYGIRDITTPVAVQGFPKFVKFNVEAVADVPDQGDWDDGTQIWTEQLSVDATPAWNNGYTSGESAGIVSGKNSAKVQFANPDWTTTPDANITAAQNTAHFTTDAATPSASTPLSLGLYSQSSTSGLTATFYVTHTDSSDSHRIIKRTATCSDNNLVASNIKSGVSIFGVTGSYAPSSGNFTGSDVDLNGDSNPGPYSNAPTTNPTRNRTNVTGYIWGRQANGKWYNLRSFTLQNGATGMSNGLWSKDENGNYYKLAAGHYYWPT